MKNLIKAVNSVMEACETVSKNLTVGVGNNAYKGVGDKDVKLMVNRAMRDNGLALFPTDVETDEKITEFTDNYGKPKKSVFISVKTKYLLIHESGEQIELTGYGHGVDSQDKAAGKATTYALKYTLLYTFLVATGDIDDADKTHSDDIKPPSQQNKPQTGNNDPAKAKDKRPFVKSETAKAAQLTDIVKSGQKTLLEVLKVYRLEKTLETNIKRVEFENEKSNK